MSMRYDDEYEVWIDKSAPRYNHCLSSLGDSRDAKQCPNGHICIFAPRLHQENKSV